jgi:hypothetical protein
VVVMTCSVSTLPSCSWSRLPSLPSRCPTIYFPPACLQSSPCGPRGHWINFLDLLLSCS